MIAPSLCRATVLLVAVLLGTAACGSSGSPVASLTDTALPTTAPAVPTSAPATTPTSAPTSAPTAAATDDLTALPTPTTPPSAAWPTGAWAALVDKATRVRFQLPSKVDPESRTRDGMVGKIVGRVYKNQVGIGAKAGYLVVSVIRADAAVRLDYARTSYTEAVKALEAQGAKDARLFDVRTASVPKGQALDSTLTYVAAGGSRTYWRQRTVILGTLVVQLQALGARLDERKIDRAFNRLTRSVVLG